MLVETASWGPVTGWVPSLPQPDGRATLVLVFGSHPDAELLARPLADLARTWDGQVVLGCSTPAQLGHAQTSAANDTAALVMTVARFDRTELHHCHVDIARAGGPRGAGREIAESIAESMAASTAASTAASAPGSSLRAVLVLGDGHVTNGAALAAGFAERLPGTPLTGGLAGEGDPATTAWTLVDGERRTGHVSAVGFIGEYLELGFGAAGGWDVFGPERLITQSYGNVLYELDGRPALSLYRDYLGPEADELPARAVAYPMAIRDLDDRTVVRTVWAVNPMTDSVRFGGDVPQGSIAQLLQSSPDHLVEGAHTAAARAAIGDEELAIAVSCVGRRLVLGDRVDEEIDAAREALAADVPVAGFYSLGSLAPSLGGSDLHNQTMTITTLREHPGPVPA